MKLISAVILLSIFAPQAQAGCCKLPSIKSIVKAVVESPAVVIRETARVIEKNTGGDISKVAGNVKDESNRAVDNVHVAVEGVSDAIDTLDERPLDGLARLSACTATACASEVVAHKRAQEIRAKKEAEYKDKVKQAEKENIQVLKNTMSNRINELEEDKKIINEQIATLENTILISETIQDNATSSVDVPESFRAFATDANMALVQNYYSALHSQLTSPEFSESDYNRYLELESQVLDAAKLANVDYNTFLNAVLVGISKNQELAMSLESTNEELLPELEALSISLEESLAEVESEIIDVETKMGAL